MDRRAIPHVHHVAWRVRGSRDEVWAILQDVTSFPQWWPALMVSAVEADRKAGDEDSRLFNLEVRTLLGGLVQCSGSVRSVAPPDDWSLALHGDLEGSAGCTLVADGDHTRVIWDVSVTVDQGVVPLPASVVQRWVPDALRRTMAHGERSMALEVDRRAAKMSDGLGAVPPPPQPVFTSGLPVTLAVTGVLSALAGVVVLVLRRRPQPR